MRLKIYRAGTVAAAMAQARTELGADALILSTRRSGGGVELTVALEPPEAAAPAIAAVPQAAAPLRAHHASCLTWHGIPQEAAHRLAEGDLSHALGGLLRFGPLPLGPDAAPLLFTGPPGAGKTLTTARLATRLVMAGLRPLVITADGRRAGAAEELAAYTRLLGISLIVASQPAALARALHHRTGGAPVLIDSTGAGAFDRAALHALQSLTASAGATPVLVLPAGQDPYEAADQAAAYAAVGVGHLLPTRLDLARRLGGIVTAAAAGGLILTEAGTGPGASDGLTRLTPDFLAGRLTRTTPEQP
jgi:flagellar biosynthesis protein FlhF